MRAMQYRVERNLHEKLSLFSKLPRKFGTPTRSRKNLPNQANSSQLYEGGRSDLIRLQVLYEVWGRCLTELD